MDIDISVPQYYLLLSGATGSDVLMFITSNYFLQTIFQKQIAFVVGLCPVYGLQDIILNMRYHSKTEGEFKTYLEANRYVYFKF